MCVLITQLRPTLCGPMDYSPPGSSVHGILQARTLERVAISSFRGFPWPRYWTQVSCIAGTFFTVWLTREALVYNTSHTNNILKSNKQTKIFLFLSYFEKDSSYITTASRLASVWEDFLRTSLLLGSLGQPRLEMKILDYCSLHSAAQSRAQKLNHL